MKTFKLIEEYPGSPELGTSVELIGLKEDKKAYGEVGKESGVVYFNVEQYPRFWRNTENFTILSFINQTLDVFKLRDNGLYYYKTWSDDFRGLAKNNLLTMDHMKIHSVQRFSDGKVFTVGDSFTVSKSSSKKIIKSIVVNPIYAGGIELLTRGGSSYAISIEELTPVEKEPLFTTEDGVEIFEGDYWYYLVLETRKIGRTNNLEYKGNPSNKKEVLRFSSEESVLEYLENRKPIFTTKDGVDLYHPSEYKNIYGVAVQAAGPDKIRRGYKMGVGEYATPSNNRVWFFGKENAKKYLLFNQKCLSAVDIVNYLTGKNLDPSELDPNFIQLLKDNQ